MATFIAVTYEATNRCRYNKMDKVPSMLLSSLFLFLCLVKHDDNNNHNHNAQHLLPSSKRTYKKYKWFVPSFHSTSTLRRWTHCDIAYFFSLRSCAPIFLPSHQCKYQRIKCEQTNRKMCQPWLANRRTHSATSLSTAQQR